MSVDVGLEEVYRDNASLPTVVAKRVKGRMGGNLRELEEEASSRMGVELVERWGDYDSSRASPRTWLYHRVYWALMTYCEGRRVHLQLGPGIEGRRASWIERLLGELSPDGRELVRTILEAPEELWRRRPGHPFALTRRKIRGYCEESLGWDRERFWSAWSEVEELVRV